MAIKKINVKKDLAYYFNLPWSYTIEIDRDNKGNKIYVVRVNELPEAITDALTLEKAMKLIQEALTLALEMRLELGQEIPEPATRSQQEQFKGNIAYRTTPDRHIFIVKEAKKHRLSLSRYLDILIDASRK